MRRNGDRMARQTAPSHRHLAARDADERRAERRPTIVSARRIEPAFGRPLAKNLSAAQNAGLRYERAFGEALATEGFYATIEDHPWFAYWTDEGAKKICSPDFVATFFPSNITVVIETKVTYTPVALEALYYRYCPIVRHITLAEDVRALVVVKNLCAGAPEPAFTISDALKLAVPIYQWSGKEKVIW